MFAAMMCTATSAWALSGTGTSGDPYLIGSVSDWNEFATKVSNGESNIYVKLTVNTVGKATSISASEATQITTSQLNTQTYVDLLQTGKSTTYWGLKSGQLTWVSHGPEVKFMFGGKQIFSLYAEEIGGTVSVPSVAEMESTYCIQDATFTYNDAPFTSSPVPSFADYTLTSSKPSVATVAQDGTVTYVGPGTTTITATANDDPTKTASIVM